MGLAEMAAYRRVYDSRHLQANCQEPGSAPEPYTRQSTMPDSRPLYIMVDGICEARTHAFGRGRSEKVRAFWNDENDESTEKRSRIDRKAFLTWYVEYEVVGAVELTGRVDGPTRVDAVVGRRHAHQLEPAM